MSGRKARRPARLPNPAKTLADLPAGSLIRLFEDGDSIEVHIFAPDDYPLPHILAYLRATRDATPDCYEISDSEAQHGWGPLAYDIMMERATELDMSLVPGHSSLEARAVWERYLDRPDVMATYNPLRQSWQDDDIDLPDLTAKYMFRKQPKLLHEISTMSTGNWSADTRWDSSFSGLGRRIAGYRKINPAAQSSKRQGNPTKKKTSSAYRQVPPFLASGQAVLSWIKKNVEFDEDDDPDFVADAAITYASLAQDFYRAGEIKVYRTIRLMPDRNGKYSVYLQKLGKSWSSREKGAGVFNAQPGKSAGDDILIHGRVAPSDVDWEWGFEAFQAYPEQWEISMIPHSTVWIDKIEKLSYPRFVEGRFTPAPPRETLLRGPVLGSTGDSDESWW